MTPLLLLAMSAMLALLVGCGGTPDPPVGVPDKAGTSAQVKRIIAKQFSIAEDQFSLGDPIVGGKLGAEALDLVDLVRELEDHFQITLPEAVLIGSEADPAFQAGLTGQQLADLVQGELQKK